MAPHFLCYRSSRSPSPRKLYFQSLSLVSQSGPSPPQIPSNTHPHQRYTNNWHRWRHLLTDTVATETNEIQTAEQDRTETPLESLASICTVLAIGLFVMTFIFQNFEIPSASMVK